MMKWLTKKEVRNGGFYLLLRIDDTPITLDEEPFSLSVVMIKEIPEEGRYVFWGKKDGYQDIWSVDDECRFYGPINFYLRWREGIYE